MVMEPRALWPLVTSPLLSLRGKAAGAGRIFRRGATRWAGRKPGFLCPPPFGARSLRAAGATVGRRHLHGRSRAIESGRHDAQISGNGTAAWRIDPRRSSQQFRPGRAESGARTACSSRRCDGMQALATAVAAPLPAETVRLNAPVSRLQSRLGGGWDIVLERRGPARAFRRRDPGASGPSGGAPGAAAGRRARHIARGDSLRQLGRCRFGLQRFAIRKAARRFWHRRARHRESTDPGRELHERQFTTGGRWAGRFLARFLGGAARPELVEASDAEVFKIAREQMQELIGGAGQPAIERIVRWQRAMPQYHLGHLEGQRDQRPRRQAPWAGTGGQCLRGGRQPHCIRSGEAAAGRVLESKGLASG